MKNSTDKIAILYIIDIFSKMAGAERNLFEIVTRLNPQKFIPSVACLHGGKLLNILRDSWGIEVMDMGLSRIYTPNAVIKAIRIFKFIKQKNIKIVVTYHEGSDFFGGIIARLAGVPVVVSSRRDMGYKLKKRHFLFYKALNRLFDRIITVSDAVKEVIYERQDALWNKLVTIHNGVELEKFDIKPDKDYLRESLGLEKHRPVVGILAALRPIKGHKYFLEAASIILKSLPGAYFLVIGWYDDENYYNELQNLTKKLGIEKNVFFIGGRTDTAETLSIVDVAVLSSINEGFPNAVLEYMAAGKPVVATEGGGTKEAVIHKETGLLVSPHDANALAGAIESLLRNEGARERMGELGRERAGTFFSIAKMIQRTEALYDDLLLKKENSRLYHKSGGIIELPRIFIDAAKTIVSGALYYSGALFMIKKASHAANSIKILCYHRITDDCFDPLCMNIKVDVFEEMVRHLKKNYNIISLEKAVGLLKSGEGAPENTIVITFDDGYRDNYTNAFPILKKYDVPATIFLTAGAINSGDTLWYSAVVDAFEKTDKTYVDLRYLNLGAYPLVSNSDKLRAAKEAAIYSKYFKKEERDIFLKNILKELGVNCENGSNSHSMLTWNDIKIMEDSGVSFASHGMYHSILTTLTPEQAQSEIASSKRLIKEKTGIDVSFFSYPNGESNDFNKEIVEMLKGSGYRAACSLIRGSNKNAPLFALRRYCITYGMISNVFGNFSKILFEAKTANIC